jgi:hypothetical protein
MTARRWRVLEVLPGRPARLGTGPRAHGRPTERSALWMRAVLSNGPGVRGHRRARACMRRAFWYALRTQIRSTQHKSSLRGRRMSIEWLQAELLGRSRSIWASMRPWFVRSSAGTQEGDQKTTRPQSGRGSPRLWTGPGGEPHYGGGGLWFAATRCRGDSRVGPPRCPSTRLSLRPPVAPRA